MTTACLRVRAHAKVNLFLRVMGRRADGYHEIETILHGVRLADEIDVEKAPAGVTVDMQWGPGVTGPLPAPPENLATSAVRLFQSRMGQAGGARVRVVKSVPIGAGLGGGSADSAGVLVALNELWRAGLDADALVRLAADIGSDVPYCVRGGTVLATGRGENLTPLPGAEMCFVLGVSFRPLLTRDVYRAWDELGSIETGRAAPMILALGAGDAGEVAPAMHNDLEPAACTLRPELAGKKKVMVAAGALGALVSGSGPTIFGLARNQDHAEAVAARVEEHFDRVLVVASQERCIEKLG
ncbi:4-(cytidine 5'-diphospho)-2-C-methyl-D-erythritol kinase [soil metagenome]